MQHKLIAGSAAMIVAFGAPAVAAEAASWTFNAPPGAGYSIELDAADPTPGTPLVRGSTVAFKFSVKYSLQVAKSGSVVVVFQDDQDKNAAGDRKQITAKVEKGSGSLVLEDSIVVPSDSHELLVFVPLVPEGMTTTTGEITIRYPITTRADGPQYMPYPLAQISAEEWDEYRHSVEQSCGSTLREFPKEHLEVFECPANALNIALTTAGHPAHPAWITRQVREGVVNQIGYFAGPEAPFAELFQSYRDLTDRTIKKISVEDSE